MQFLKTKKVPVLVAVGLVILGLLYMSTSPDLLWEATSLPLPYRDTTATSNIPRITKRNTTNTGTQDDGELDEILPILTGRLERYSGPKYKYTQEKCSARDSASKPCYDTACPVQFSPSPRERLKQVLKSRAAIPAPYLQAIASAARAVTPHKYIFVTGASSNHFHEMQALMHTVHNSLFPRMKGENYTLVFYNLGLSVQQRKLTEKNCRCTVLDFPFAGLPDFISALKCYAWKPIIISSLLEKAEYLVWLDASIRLRNSDPFPEMFQRAKENGYQAQINSGSIAVRTRESMAKFFGDQHLCQYSPFTEMEATFMVFYNDRFTREAVIKPWVSCAFSEDCMCIKDHEKYINCGGQSKKRFYGRCHRFDQSGIGMIFSKLYLEYRPMLYVPHNTIKIERDTKMDWFKLR